MRTASPRRPLPPASPMGPPNSGGPSAARSGGIGSRHLIGAVLFVTVIYLIVLWRFAQQRRSMVRNFEVASVRSDGGLPGNHHPQEPVHFPPVPNFPAELTYRRTRAPPTPRPPRRQWLAPTTRQPSRDEAEEDGDGRSTTMAPPREQKPERKIAGRSSTQQTLLPKETFKDIHVLPRGELVGPRGGPLNPFFRMPPQSDEERAAEAAGGEPFWAKQGPGLFGRQKGLQTSESNDDASINRLLALYEDVPLPPDAERDPFFDNDPETKDLWKALPKLRLILEKSQALNRGMRASSQGMPVNGKKKNGFLRPRVVSVQPVGQLCNRLMAITSAFFFALVTRRALVVDDSGFYCQSSDLFVDPGFPWVNGGRSNFGGFGSGTRSISNPDSGTWAEMESLLCSDYADAYPEDHIHFSINQFMVPYITTNPHYRADLIAIFRGESFFHPIARFLFRPRGDILAMRDKYIKQRFANRFVVGLQVRSGGDFTDNFMNERDWGLYGRCGEQMTPAANYSQLAFFVATDTAKGREAAKKHIEAKFGHKVMFGPGEFMNSNNPKGVQMALLDLLLLAAADDRVTTAWSSYGYFASGYSGFGASGAVVDEVPKDKWVSPVIKELARAENAPSKRDLHLGEDPLVNEQRFMGVPHKSDRRRQCVRLPTTDPCFHKFASWGGAKATCAKTEWFEREMMHGRYC